MPQFITRNIWCSITIFVIVMICLVLPTPAPPKDLNKLVDNRFQILEVLGHGQYGIVYGGVNIHDKTEVAMKFSYHENRHHLQEEYDFQMQLAGTSGIARAFYCGVFDKDYSVLVMERLGHDLEPYVPPHLSRLPAETVLNIASSLMTTFEGFHDRGLVHRDIKPNNLAFGLGENDSEDRSRVFLFDFNRCTYYKNTTTEVLYPPSKAKSHPTRATSYTPPSLVAGKAYSRRDDMLAVGYVLLHLAGKGLPWDCHHEHDAVKIMKHTTPKTFCNGLPDAFRRYFDHIYSLGFYDRPDYNMLKNEFLITDAAELKASAPWIPSSLCLVFV